MNNSILISIGLILFVLALLGQKKKMKGKRGCCGSDIPIPTNKELAAPELGQITLKLDGICCENCLIRVGNSLNELDGVACITNFEKKTASVSYSREISPGELEAVVEKLGYLVSEIL